MTRIPLAVLLTVGDPHTLTGGYLFHRRLADLAPRHGFRMEFASFPQRPFPLAILDAPRVLARIAAQNPEVVVLDSIAASFMAFQGPDAPMLAMMHQPPGGIDHGPLRTRVQAWLDRRAYRGAQRLMVASESLAADLRAQGQPPERITVVPPGRDVAGDTGPPPGDLRQGRAAALLCVGNWVARKGILSLLDAFAALDEGTATLHLVGDTRADPVYAARVHTRLARTDMRDRVVAHGPLTTNQVAAMYAAADAFVLPSLKEPYGTVYGEAMAFGLPVVGWRAGNLPYLADDEEEGLLVEAGDLGGLAVALRRLAEDVDLRHRLGAAAQRRAVRRPTWDEVATVFFDHLRAAIAEAQATSPA